MAIREGKNMKVFKKSILLIIASFSLLLASCNGGKQVKPYITISPDTIEMYEDEYSLVEAKTNSKKQISFASENSDVVSVNSSGVLLAKSAGTTVVKATVEDIFAVCSITVKPISEKIEEHIEFEKSLFVVGLNDEVTENRIVPTFYHGEQAISGKTFEYTSLKPTIASVSSDGVITINSVGIASIMVTCESIKATVIVDIYDIIIRDIEDWEDMLKTTGNKNARFYLDNDLDFEGVEYSPYSSYGNNLMGELKGNYHTVSNITMKENGSIQSIFGFASVFALTDIRFINTTFTSLTKNGGLFTSLYQHYSEIDEIGKSVTLTGSSIINNVLCDFVFSDVTSCFIADKFYGGNVDNVYVRASKTSGEPLKEADTYLMAYSYYTWYGTSHFINMIGLVENGSITKQVKKADPSDDLYYPDTITDVKTDVAGSIIEANYLASLNFDSNIWDIKPNELPTFLNN